MTKIRAINFGCGLSVADDWINYDGSPTLRLQRMSLVGAVFRRLVGPRFPELAIFGDVVRGLPEQSASVDYVYSSHVLEHLALADFRIALREIFRVLKPGGIFRGVLPDLEADIKTYLNDGSDNAASNFMEATGLGVSARSRGLTGLVRDTLGNSQHLWMWDYKNLSGELLAAGFVQSRRATWGDSGLSIFISVEEQGRWNGCLGFECRKPA